jgi:hypothetical protein
VYDQWVNLLKFLLSIGILGVAWYYNRDGGRVPNRLWYIIGICGIILNIFQYQNTYYSIILMAILGVILVFVVIYILYYTTQFISGTPLIGGAISKSIIAIAIVYPTPPILLNHPIAPVLPFFAITVLLNSFVISMPTILPDISKKVGSPFMGFIAIGYLIGILYGDIIFSILSVILTGIKL